MSIFSQYYFLHFFFWDSFYEAKLAEVIYDEAVKNINFIQRSWAQHDGNIDFLLDKRQRSLVLTKRIGVFGNDIDEIAVSKIHFYIK